MSEQNLPPQLPEDPKNSEKKEVALQQPKPRTEGLARLVIRTSWLGRAAELIDKISEFKEVRDAEIAKAEAEGKKPISLTDSIKTRVTNWYQEKLKDNESTLKEISEKYDEILGKPNSPEPPGKYGKLVSEFIQEEKERSLKEEPYYRVVARDERQLSSLERRLQKAEQEIEQHKSDTRYWGSYSDTWNSAATPKDLSKEKQQIEHKIKVLQERQQERELTDYLAKFHSNPNVKPTVSRLLDNAEHDTEVFVKNYLEGTVEQKHHTLVTTAVKALGKDYFDPEKHPDRVLRLLKFTGERLYMDGHEVADIRASYASNPFTPNIKPNDNWLSKQTDFEKSTELNRVRLEIMEWRVKNNPEAQTIIENTIKTFDHRNPSEFKQAQAWMTRDKTIALWAVPGVSIAADGSPEQRYFEAKQVYDRYMVDYRAGINTKLSTKEEYQVEFIRQVALGITQNRLHEADVDIAAKLRIAGHSDADIAKAVQEASIFRTTKDYGEVILENAKEHLLTPEGQAEKERIRLLKENHPHLKNETRLNRLTLDTKDPVHSVPRTELEIRNSIPQDYYETPKSRDIDIGR